MGCEKVMVRDVYTITADIKVSEALAVLLKKKVRSIPVVDRAGVYEGMFNFTSLVGKLLPYATQMEHGLESLAFGDDDMEYISGRFDELMTKDVRDVMRTDVPVLEPDTVFEEALLKIHHSDSPLPVIEEKTGKLLGLFTKQSAVDVLMHWHDKKNNGGV